MTQVCTRLEQEVTRLGYHYDHMLNESVDSNHDTATVKSGCMAASTTCFNAGLSAHEARFRCLLSYVCLAGALSFAWSDLM